MRHAVVLGVATLVLSAAVPHTASAQPLEPDVTTEEYRCMSVASRASQRFVKNRFKCVTKCFQRYWALQSVEAECVPPYAGETLACIAAADGVDARLTAAIVKKCDVARGKDCPECWSGGDCSASGEAGARPDVLGPPIDALLGEVFCERASAAQDERDCQLKTSKYLAKLVRNVGRCADVCAAQARAGAVDFAQCLDASSPTMGVCLAALRARPVAAIYAACEDKFADPDGCGDPYPAADDWAAIAESTFLPELGGPNYCSE
jgi:hypothetical protein